MKRSLWHEDWQVSGTLSADTATMVRTFRREQKKLALVLVGEFAVLAGLLGLAGFALLRGPQISDTIWAAGVGVFLAVVACAILLSRRRPRTPAQRPTREFLAAYQASCLQRLRVLRWTWIALVLGTLALLPFAAWRYRAGTAPFTSHHGAFSAGATAALLLAAGFWIRFWQRRTASDLETVRSAISREETDSDII